MEMWIKHLSYSEIDKKPWQKNWLEGAKMYLSNFPSVDHVRILLVQCIFHFDTADPRAWIQRQGQPIQLGDTIYTYYSYDTYGYQVG